MKVKLKIIALILIAFLISGQFACPGIPVAGIGRQGGDYSVLSPKLQLSENIFKYLFANFYPDFITRNRGELSDTYSLDYTNELFTRLIDALFSAGLELNNQAHLDYIGTIRIASAKVTDEAEAIERLINAAPQIADFISSFENEGIGSDYIGSILELIIPLRGVRNTAQRLGNAAADIADLIRVVGAQNYQDYYVHSLIESIVLLDDVRQRSVTLKSLFPHMHVAGKTDRAILSIISRIAYQKDIDATARRLVTVTSEFRKGKIKTKRHTKRFGKLAREGRFRRSIVGVHDEAGEEGIGSAFVAFETDKDYFLFTNSHVAEDLQTAVVKTRDKEPKVIGGAEVVWRQNRNWVKHGDVAVLKISKRTVMSGELGGELIVLKMAEIFDTKSMVCLVSGYNNTVSSGYPLLLNENSLYLIGAESHPGDSGSPVLVMNEEGYFVVGIHTAAGPVVTLITEEIKQDILRTSESRGLSRFILQFNPPRFLENIKASGSCLSFLVEQAV